MKLLLWCMGGGLYEEEKDIALLAERGLVLQEIVMISGIPSVQDSALTAVQRWMEGNRMEVTVLDVQGFDTAIKGMLKKIYESEE